MRLALIGQLSLTQRARLDERLAHHEDLLASLDTPDRRSELAIVPDSAGARALKQRLEAEEGR